MPKAIAQVALHREGGLPEDDCVNVWHFDADSDYSGNAPGLLDRIEAFYTAISNHLMTALSGTATTKLYNWEDDAPRAPTHEENWTFTPGQGTLPAEVATCLSMAAQPTSGLVQARRRGRVYIGPLGAEVVDYATATSPDVRPTDAWRTQLLDAAEDLALGTPGSFRLAIYSPTTKQLGGTDDAAWNDVETLWVDDAFDIVRKRGARPTSRMTRTLSG